MNAVVIQPSTAPQVCNEVRLFLDTAEETEILSYLCDEAETAEQGWAAMTYLKAKRPDAANGVLCTLYDVKLTCVEDKGGVVWAVPLSSGAALHRSLESARSFAVEDLGLVDKFFEPF